jgi:hypothetical protein
MPFDFTKKQYENLATAMSNLSPITMRVTQDQINKGGGNIMITNRQQNHLNKSIEKNKGANLCLSSTQLKKMRTAHKRGGYLTDMTKAIAGEGMFGVDAPPKMPRDAGVGAEPQDGAGMFGVDAPPKMPRDAGVGAEPQDGAGVIGTLKRTAKATTKAAAAIACGTAMGAKTGNPLAASAAAGVCHDVVDSMIGSGKKHAPKKVAPKKAGRPKKIIK